jgi:hypothetical protein
VVTKKQQKVSRLSTYPPAKTRAKDDVETEPIFKGLSDLEKSALIIGGALHEVAIAINNVCETMRHGYVLRGQDLRQVAESLADAVTKPKATVPLSPDSNDLLVKVIGKAMDKMFPGSNLQDATVVKFFAVSVDPATAAVDPPKTEKA